MSPTVTQTQSGGRADARRELHILDRSASTGEVRLIPLRNKRGHVKAYAMVDPADYEVLKEFAWHRTAQGYAARRTQGGNRAISLMHREILGAAKGEHVEFVGPDTLDNRRANLKLSTSERPFEDALEGLTGADRAKAYGRLHYERNRDLYIERSKRQSARRRQRAAAAKAWSDEQLLCDLELKECRDCRRVLPTSEFYGRGEALYSYCKSCARHHREASVARHGNKSTKSKSNAAVDAFLKEQKAAPCVDCGSRFPPVVMHFHHRDPTEKLASVNELRRGDFERVREEVAKCDLLCANCHALRHHRDGGWGWH